MNRLVRIGMVAKITVLEALRRKDLYVLLILSLVFIGGTGAVRFFETAGFERFLKEVSLKVIHICLTVIVVTATARQLPREFEARTIYPLLAKPLSRLEFLVGKFVGCFLMGAFTLLLFNVEFFVATQIFGANLGWVFLQGVYLSLLFVALVVAMTLCFSFFLTQGANITVSLLVCFGAGLFSRSITLIHAEMGWLGQKAILGLYHVFPHVDLFDLTAKIVHGYPPIAFKFLLILTIYAVIYVVLLLGIAQLRFRRRPL